MKFASVLRQHLAAVRALLVLTVILGLGYPLLIWLAAQVPGLTHKAGGSIISVDGKPVGSALIGQQYLDGNGNALPQYFQSRPSVAGDGYDPLASGASNLGPENIVDTAGKPSLLTLVCTRSMAIGRREGVDGSRPYCTRGGVGAVLAVIGPRDNRGAVTRPTAVISLNEPCTTTRRPFLDAYEGVPVRCATPGQDYAAGQIVPIRGAAPDSPVVPADAVTASGSGLDPDISMAYADLQAARVARVRGVGVEQIRAVIADNTAGPQFGFLGERRVNVLALNIALDRLYPVPVTASGGR